MNFSRILLVLSACLIACVAAQADSIYTYNYVGPNYGYPNPTDAPYNNSEDLQFKLDFDGPLLDSAVFQQATPLDWSGFDGIHFLSSATCPGCGASFAFMASGGAIQAWDVRIHDAALGLTWTSIFACPGGLCGGDQYDMVTFPIGGGRTGEAEGGHNAPDSALYLWSSRVTTDVPEPSSLVLLATGLAGLIAVKKR